MTSRAALALLILAALFGQITAKATLEASTLLEASR